MAAPKRATPAQIINHLRKAEVQLADGRSVKEVARDWESVSRPTTGGGGSMEG
jgi:hypothetical protein